MRIQTKFFFKFCVSKYNQYSVKRPFMSLKKIFVNRVFDKQLISRIYKNHL